MSTCVPPCKARRHALPIAVITAVVGGSLLLAASSPAMQDPRGKVVSLASESTPYGMSLFRLWSNGDIEVMVLGQSNVWSDWIAVAPGKSGWAPGGKSAD
jgi:hypothetical protein